MDYLRLLRPEQWIKNLFVFIPVFFSGEMLNGDLLLLSFISFIIFSLAASCVYILNDYIDKEADRNHPEKNHRPLARGTVSEKGAVFLGGLIFLAVMGSLGFILGSHLFCWRFAVVIFFYLLMNIGYTLSWKHIAIVDVSIIALGFVLRVLAGGYMTGIPISQWAILLTFVLALVLAVGKRRGELVNAEITGSTRKSLDGYNVQFADIVLSIACGFAIVCYLMFTLSPDVQRRFHPRIFYTVIFVLFAFMRYLQQTLVYNRTESPTKIVYRDRYIQVTLALWFIFFLLQLYFK